ncbi:FGGY-family carbohydrate kinase [Microbacterium sp. NIBRBAC000506063]|uniref:FGGY-family carbohydrate kinase n=1 Tax=Microbacterium sp. NIBRBAC000506063 TaxID=2734618 RepID=UPI001BB7245F|nr:FGGY-family carbohydrate kinase [Microbacterium sp. NIBRBAC000506063]QTV80139.1 hypothetical protein KAE78_03450 [Microbacterium sp. NIBRBAC000506063]
MAVAGGHDHVVAASAVGRALPRTVVDSMGTAEVVVVQLDGFPARRPAGVDLSPGIEHSGAALFVVHELARNVDWIRRTRPDAASAIDTLLEHPTARPLPTRPVFEFGESGGREPRWLPEAHDLDPEDLAFRALVDCARVGAASITRLRALDDREPTPIHAVGGWTRSRGWLALKSAVLGEPILALDETEATAVGVALIAGDALGWHQDAGRALGSGDAPRAHAQDDAHRW